MKRSLIALGILAAAASVAHAAPTVYGKLNLSLDNVNDDTKNTIWQADSNASRFGIKGDADLTSSLKAVYQVEWEVNGVGSSAPYNASTDLSQRNRFLGLQDKDIGTFKIGRWDTYTKSIGQNIDLFADQLADNSNVLAGKTRLSNVIGYESPTFAGFNVNLMIQPGEASQSKASTVSADNGISNAESLSVTWSDKDTGLSAAFGYDKDVMDKFAMQAAPSIGTVPAATTGNVPNGTGQYNPADNGTARTNLARLIVGLNLKDAGLSFNLEGQSAERAKSYTYGTATTAVKPKETGFLANAAWKFAEGWTGKLQYAASTTKFDDGVNQDIKLSQIALGADYNFTATTKVYGFYTILDKKNDNNPSVATAAAPGVDNSEQLKALSLGIDHKF